MPGLLTTVVHHVNTVNIQKLMSNMASGSVAEKRFQKRETEKKMQKYAGNETKMN